MKASLINALAEAKAHSLKHPDTIVYVLDKKKNTPKVITNNLVFWKALNEGYGPVTKFKNGIDLGD